MNTLYQFKSSAVVMGYELWESMNYHHHYCYTAESGLDRELDFDEERWKENEYFNNYLKKVREHHDIPDTVSEADLIDAIETHEEYLQSIIECECGLTSEELYGDGEIR